MKFDDPKAGNSFKDRRFCDELKEYVPIDLFLDSDSLIIAYHISLVNVQTNYCDNNVLVLDVKQLNKIMKFYYFKSTVGWPG